MLYFLKQTLNMHESHIYSFLTHFPFTGIIFGRDIERFAHFSVKNLIENGLMGEKSHSKM